MPRLHRRPYGLLWSSNPDTLYTAGYGGCIGGISNFFRVDWLGSTRYLSDSTGNSFPTALLFDAFGNRT